MNRTAATTILVIEDDATIREGIQTVLTKAGYQVEVAADGFAGSRLFRERPPGLVITDLKLPGKSGMHLLQEFLEAAPDLPVMLISAFGTIDLAVNALKSGAVDFIAKPFSTDELKTKVAEILKDRPASRIVREDTTAFHGLVGSSPVMQELQAQIRQVATVDSPVLVTGESGTGKELISRAIHAISRRRQQVFLAVNCGAFTETLLESELFGHEKGAFTGAIRQHQGIFEQADGGTIFLDEIGEISPQLQVKLLRVLQDGTFQRLGGTKESSANIRVIAATNRNLRAAVDNRQFREDLYFRLNVLPIAAPALREHRTDMPELIDHILDLRCRRLGKARPQMGESALDKLQRYAWPGNVRELENLLERILIFSGSETITGDDILFDEEPVGESPGGTLTDVLEDTEYRMIKDALEQAGGVKQRAARLLGVKTSTLYYKMDKYGLGDDKSEPHTSGPGTDDQD